MIQSINFPLWAGTLAQYGGWAQLQRDLRALGVDGIEGIWGGGEIPSDLPPGLLQGYHLTFTPDWLDFYRWNTAELRRKFGSLEKARAFYGGGPESLLAMYRADLERAKTLGARYVVFHVSDVSIEEGYTYRWLHSSAEVLEASAELINALLADAAPTFDFLVENQWWPGFTFTDPEQTALLLDAIDYPRKGILLDTGHLMNCFPEIRTEAQGAEKIGAMLDRHGELCRWIRGVHLHQSLSGAYVRAHTGKVPEGLPEAYVERFSFNYAHIQSIDQHQPWTDGAIGAVLRRIAPQYLTHELSAPAGAAHLAAVKRQVETLRRSGFLPEA